MPAEFVQIVQGFAARRDLAVCLCANGHCRPPGDDAEFYRRLVQPWHGVQFYLVPPLAGEPGPIPDAPNPRLLGWFKVNPGRLHATGDGWVLTMSSLVTEDRQGLPFRPARWLRLLRQDLGNGSSQPPLRLGVTGANAKFGGETLCPQIVYSEAAKSLQISGTRWKQFFDGNVEFRPLE